MINQGELDFVLPGNIRPIKKVLKSFLKDKKNIDIVVAYDLFHQLPKIPLCQQADLF